MQTQALYDLAKQQNIDVYTFPMPLCGSMSVMDESGSCAIGLDPGLENSGCRERVHLSHELGHCLTGSFYNIHATVDHRQRHENRADKWAIKKLIPVSALDDAVASGCTELWELAERFGVTEKLYAKGRVLLCPRQPCHGAVFLAQNRQWTMRGQCTVQSAKCKVHSCGVAPRRIEIISCPIVGDGFPVPNKFQFVVLSQFFVCTL